MRSKKLSLLLLAATIIWGCGSADIDVSRADSPDTAGSGASNENRNSATKGGSENSGDSAKPVEGIESIYTDIGLDKCRTIEEKKDLLTIVAECKGVAGYKLELLDIDDRQTVNVIFPDGRKHQLNFHKVVSPAFSNTGDKAEWRVVREEDRIKPVALIVRFVIDGSLADPVNGTDISYLTVSKITKDAACVTDFVKPEKNQNEKARRLADASADKPCLKEYPWHSDDVDEGSETVSR